MTTTEAPNIRHSYPLAGERIGPAWRDVWALLVAAPEIWREGLDLGLMVAPRHSLDPTSVQAMLSTAARHGVLERRYRMIRSRTRAEYRLAERHR